MDFQTAVKTCFQKYATFSGRAKRPEFWWFILFYFVVGCILNIIDGILFGFSSDIRVLSSIFGLAIFLPNLAVAVRRLHDIGRSGWWILIGLIPFVGWIVLIYWYCQPSEQGTNQYG